jgi:hypothetical protein
VGDERAPCRPRLSFVIHHSRDHSWRAGGRCAEGVLLRVGILCHTAGRQSIRAILLLRGVIRCLLGGTATARANGELTGSSSPAGGNRHLPARHDTTHAALMRGKALPGRDPSSPSPGSSSGGPRTRSGREVLLPLPLPARNRNQLCRGN